MRGPCARSCGNSTGAADRPSARSSGAGPGVSAPGAEPWRGPARAHAGPHLSGPQINSAHSANWPVLHGAVFLATRLSRSRTPRLGRSLRSRRIRSAAPTLDTESTHLGLAPIQDDG